MTDTPITREEFIRAIDKQINETETMLLTLSAAMKAGHIPNDPSLIATGEELLQVYTAIRDSVPE
jgi:hypothetical protein